MNKASFFNLKLHLLFDPPIIRLEVFIKASSDHNRADQLVQFNNVYSMPSIPKKSFDTKSQYLFNRINSCPNTD